MTPSPAWLALALLLRPALSAVTTDVAMTGREDQVTFWHRTVVSFEVAAEHTGETNPVACVRRCIHLRRFYSEVYFASLYPSFFHLDSLPRNSTSLCNSVTFSESTGACMPGVGAAAGVGLEALILQD
jgi:hypothetical protein